MYATFFHQTQFTKNIREHSGYVNSIEKNIFSIFHRIAWKVSIAWAVN